MKGLQRLIAVVATLSAAGIATALWVGGISWSVTGSATTGSPQDSMTCSGNFDITSNDNATVTCVYDNPDGEIVMSFEMTDNMQSTDEACNYEQGEDLVMYVGEDWYLDGSWKEITDYQNANITITSGTHNIVLKIVPSPNRCPLSGNLTITGTQV